MGRSRDISDTDPPDDVSDEVVRHRRRTPVEVPTDRPASLAELAGVSDDLGQLEHRVSRAEKELREVREVRAEWLGRNGGGGRIGRMESDVNRLGTRQEVIDTRVGLLETWRTAVIARTGVYMGIGGLIAGAIAAIAVKLIEKLW